MIDDVCACFVCGAETGTCLHLEPELRPFLAAQRHAQAIQFGRLVDSVEEAAKREYIARVVKHRRYSSKARLGNAKWAALSDRSRPEGLAQGRGLADAAGEK